MFLQTHATTGTKSVSLLEPTTGTSTDSVTGSLSAGVGPSPTLSSLLASSSSVKPPLQSQSFLIAFGGPPLLNQGAPALAGRQAKEEYYINHDGLVILDCRESALFTLDSAGQLFGDNSLITTQPGLTFQRFMPPVSGGNISTAWEDLYGVLQWRNEEFLNLVAPMCVQNGSVLIFFLIDPPIDCFPISPRKIDRE